MQHWTRNHTLDLTLCALCAAAIAVCSWITLPATIPFTLQSFAIFLILLLFEGKRATVSVTVYLLLGAVGLPVFAGMKGGIGVLSGPTGGFLIGFLVMALLDWGISLICKKRSLVVKVVCLAAEQMVCYLFGSLWYWLYTGSGGLGTAFAVCVLPFLPVDSLKLLLATAIYHPIRKRISHI
ncbi:MAG: biotin transporter BioY [Oscillospiraceae bacterium]